MNINFLQIFQCVGDWIEGWGSWSASTTPLCLANVQYLRFCIPPPHIKVQEMGKHGRCPLHGVFIQCAGLAVQFVFLRCVGFETYSAPYTPSNITFVSPPSLHEAPIAMGVSNRYGGGVQVHKKALPQIGHLLINSFPSIWSVFLQAQSSEHRHLLWWTGASEEENLNVTSIADNWRSLAKESQAGFLQPASPNGSIFSPISLRSELLERNHTHTCTFLNVCECTCVYL